MPDEDAINVPELDELSEGNKGTQTIEEQAAAIKLGEPDEGDEPTEGKPDDKKADEKPPTADEHKAVMAELKRVRKLNAEKSDEASEVKERLAKMEGKLEAGSGGESTPKQKLAKYNDRELVKLQMQWEDERDTARGGDDPAALSKSKANIEAIRIELHERTTTQAAKASETKADEDAILTEAAALIKEAVEAWPDLENEDSEIFKAARAEFQSKPKVYRQLGVFADVVAAASAVAKNPKLMGTGHDKVVRKELTKEITKAAEKAVHAGGGGTGVKPSFDVEAMDSEAIEAMAEKLKAGGSLTK